MANACGFQVTPAAPAGKLQRSPARLGGQREREQATGTTPEAALTLRWE
jgi:hypothetical protein